MNAAISMQATIMHFATCFPDWNSLDSVRRAHSFLEGAALVFFALLVICEALAHLSDSKKTERRFDKVGIVFFAIAVLAEIVAYPYGQRNDTLSEQVIGSLDAKSREAFTNASSALTKSGSAETKADEAETKSKEALMRADTAQRSLAKAESDAGKAQTEAANALITATDASARAGKAEASLGRAEAEAKNAESSALNALRLAREARQNLASFESELAQLKKKTADRDLDEAQQERVALKIGAFLGSPYELGAVDTSEAENLLFEVDATLNSAGWIYKASEDKTFRFVEHMRDGRQFEVLHGGRGVEIALTKTLVARFKPAADRLAKALNSEEIVAFVVTLPDDNPSPNNIHIMILGKP